MSETLYTCPRCSRTGFYSRGLLAHVCQGASFLDKRRRLTAAELAQATKAGQNRNPKLETDAASAGPAKEAAS